MDAQLYLDEIYLLDSDAGLFKINVLQSQQLVVSRIYKDSGFVRFGVYRDDSQNQFLIALANRHSVY